MMEEAIRGLHVGFLTNEYPLLAPCGGIGTSIRNLARQLVIAGHRVTVLGLGPPTSFADNGVRVRFVSASHPPKLGWYFNRQLLESELRNLIRRENLSVVEAADWCGMSAGLDIGCPTVIRCHGSAIYFGHILKERVRFSVRMWERRALAAANGIAAVSRYTAEVTRALFHVRRTIGIIANGIDVNEFTVAAGGSSEPGSVLYIGSLVRKKGILDLCRAFSRVVKRAPNARLRIVGRDCRDTKTGAASTWALCEEALGLTARTRVEYAGPRPYLEIADQIRRAAVCVFPSYAEAMPLSWIEAMACGRPIVAYDIGWASEVVEDGRTGLLVPAGRIDLLSESIIRLLQSPALADEMGGRARERAESRFSIERVATESVQWYQNVINTFHA